jgi:hypothetical protein
MSQLAFICLVQISYAVTRTVHCTNNTTHSTSTSAGHRSKPRCEGKAGSLQAMCIQSRIHYDIVESTRSLVCVVDVHHQRENSSEV